MVSTLPLTIQLIWETLVQFWDIHAEFWEAEEGQVAPTMLHRTTNDPTLCVHPQPVHISLVVPLGCTGSCFLQPAGSCSYFALYISHFPKSIVTRVYNLFLVTATWHNYTSNQTWEWRAEDFMDVCWILSQIFTHDESRQFKQYTQHLEELWETEEVITLSAGRGHDKKSFTLLIYLYLYTLVAVCHNTLH